MLKYVGHFFQNQGGFPHTVCLKGICDPPIITFLFAFLTQGTHYLSDCSKQFLKKLSTGKFSREHS